MDQRLRRHAFGFWEVAARPTYQELHDYYAKKYYQEAKGSYELAYSSEELSYFRAKLEQRHAVVNSHLPETCDSRKRFLDVGCGEGFALSFFREAGWSVKGLDFSSAGVESKNPSCMDALVTGDVFELIEAELCAGMTYEVVWLQNVLEHVLDPIVLLESLHALVAPDGIAVVTVPNDCSITQTSALNHHHIDSAFWVAPPDHLSYFDHVSLANCAAKTGWECVEMLGDFPVDWYLFHPGSNYIRDKSAGKLAHKARVQIENYIHDQPIDDVLRFWSAAAQLGIGRDITAFLRPVGDN
jgi:2-polyprenyl-3-methyl-5-hydroxy-6-metoxy-1,4-benzoquinol methylase